MHPVLEKSCTTGEKHWFLQVREKSAIGTPSLLDIKVVIETPDAVRENLRKRGLDERVAEVDVLLRLDAAWRRHQAETDLLRKKRNEITAAIAQARKNRTDTALLMKEADAIPNQINTGWFKADKPGTYLGQCNELCGIGHQMMQARVIAMPKAEFDKWYADQQKASAASLRGFAEAA